RRWSRARRGAEPILQSNSGEVDVDQRLQRESSKESEIAEPNSGLSRVGPLTAVALGIAVLLPLVLLVIIKCMPRGQLNYEILLVGPVYFTGLGCDATLLFFGIQLDRESGRASLSVASVVAILLSVAFVGIWFMW